MLTCINFFWSKGEPKGYYLAQLRIFAETRKSQMKTKLTLSVDDKIVTKMKRDARQRGKSLSGYIEELGSKQRSLPDKQKQALRRLLDNLNNPKIKPIKAISKKIFKQMRLKHLKAKYG